MQSEQAEIDSELSPVLIWQNEKDQFGASLTVQIDGSIDDPQEKKEEIPAWMPETQRRLRDVLNPRLGKILAEMDEA